MNQKVSLYTNDSLRIKLKQQGFIHVKQAEMIDDQDVFSRFQRNWDNLPRDNHLNDSGKYRYRRYAVLNSVAGKLNKLPLEAHYQTRAYNPLHGGYYRYYREIKKEVLASSLFKDLVDWNLQLISSKRQTDWRIQCHQFRICASEKEAGKPSPEGIHQDGSDYVFIMLVNRQNVEGGINSIHDAHGETLYETTMKRAGEMIVVNDKRHWHGVSEIYPINSKKPAYRDVFVMTFHRL